MGKRKRYSDAFKRAAVARVLEGTRVAQVAHDSGASGHSIRDWVNAGEAAKRERPATLAELAEIKRLKRELRMVREDNDILKKATALFAEARR
jgi:transposase